MGARGWLIAGAAAVSGAIALSLLVHPHVGSGRACEGIGFGCTPERDTDTALIVALYIATAATTFAVSWWRSRGGRPWRAALAGGIAITLLATGLAAWSQLPRYAASPGSLREARQRWGQVLADGRAVASPGTPLGEALRGLERRGPVTCRDAYGRSTGSRQFRWSNSGPGASTRPASGSGAATAAALGRWADRLRARGVAASIVDPDGDPASDRRLQVGGFGMTAGGVLSVRASTYISELEIRAATGCHRS
jgi:hypothetical protein